MGRVTTGSRPTPSADSFAQKGSQRCTCSSGGSQQNTPEVPRSGVFCFNGSMTPHRWARFHATNIVIWVGMIPVAIITDLKTSVPFLVFISILSLIYGECGSWQAATAERRIDPTDKYGED